MLSNYFDQSATDGIVPIRFSGNERRLFGLRESFPKRGYGNDVGMESFGSPDSEEDTVVELLSEIETDM